MVKSIEDYEAFLTREIETFTKSASFAMRKGLKNWQIHSQAVADALTIARAILRTSLLPEKAQNGDVLMTYVATNPVPSRLSKKILPQNKVFS